jgi:endonuclease/exonuclease/phosphatase family metal-dependent hydrolase
VEKTRIHRLATVATLAGAWKKRTTEEPHDKEVEMGLLFGGKRKRGSVSSIFSLTRMLGPGVTGTGLLATLIAILTGQVDLSTLDVLRGTAHVATGSTAADIRPVDLKQMGQKSTEFIRVATFNIQVFGESKAADREVMESITQIVSQFDVVAIQEVRSQDMTPIRVLVDMLRGSGANYAATVSQPMGTADSTHRESYAFVWDESRIRMVDQPYVVQDPADRMPREPMVASFEVRSGTAAGRQPFRFTLINVHTSPDGVASSALENEMDVLDDVYLSVRQYGYQTTGEDDFMLLGDLNVDADGLRELGKIPGLVTIAPDLKTNTRRSKTYDHILRDQHQTTEFSGRYGVLDFEAFFGISAEAALKISDHLPLWAEFSAYETVTAPPASGPGDPRAAGAGDPPQLIR